MNFLFIGSQPPNSFGGGGGGYRGPPNGYGGGGGYRGPPNGDDEYVDPAQELADSLEAEGHFSPN
jgi:hypothetical protein